MPAGHPPTLFVHGAADAVVPESTMEPYESTLHAQGIPTQRVIVQTDDGGSPAGHEFFSQSPDAILDWFNLYR